MDEIQKAKDALKEKRGKLAEIHEKTVAEKRELTPEEQAAWDTLAADVETLKSQVTTLEEAAGIADEPPADEPPPEEMMSEADRAKALGEIDAVVARPNPRRIKPPAVRQTAVRRFEIPATAYRTGRLRSFRGQDAERNAYLSGQFLLATIFGNQRAQQWCRDHGVIESRALSGNVNTAAGYLIPSVLENTIIDLRETYGVFRANTRVWPMSSDVSLIPRRTSGLTVYFAGDNAEITASDKAWDQVTLTARKMGVLCKYSSEVDEDAVISLADDLAGEIGFAFALKEDNCGFLGDGTSTYGGIHGAAVRINDGNHAASIFTAASGNTAFSTLDLADFHSVTGKLPDYARPRAAWFISRAGFSDSMERLAYAGGGNTVQTITGGAGLSFLGYPVVISQVMNSTLAADVSAIKLLFGDLALASTLGDRRGVTISTTDQRYWELDQIGIKGTARIDINVHDLGDGSTAGPLIALKTPAS